jgi:hypothetical protein
VTLVLAPQGHATLVSAVLGHNCSNQAIKLIVPQAAPEGGALSVMGIFQQLTFKAIAR